MNHCTNSLYVSDVNALITVSKRKETFFAATSPDSAAQEVTEY